MIIAEIGHNHNGNIRLAFEMIQEAKNCGADIAKFQLYDTDKIKLSYQSRYYELKAAQLDFKQTKTLKEFCDNVGIEFMASVFDIERVGWCEELEVKRYKIASRSINDHALIAEAISTGKPVIASLGNWQGPELPPFDLDYLYCISEYPAFIDPKSFPHTFDVLAGFSDHSLGCYWAREAIKRGAKIIEKHFTISKTLPGFNQKGSADPTELKDLVRYARQHERGMQF